MKRMMLLFTFLSLVFMLATVASADTLRRCKVGADPVDPTYQWVPPLDWKLVKTTQPEAVTQRGGHSEYRCELPPGHVLAYPPNGGNPVVVLCKNEIVEGRPMGNEIPRESIIFNVTPAQRGEPGPAGTSCWDTNGNGDGDDTEDVNSDGKWDARDCQSLGSGMGSGRPLCGESLRTARRWVCIGVAVLVGGGIAASQGGGGGNPPPSGNTGGNY